MLVRGHRNLGLRELRRDEDVGGGRSDDRGSGDHDFDEL